MSSRGQGGGWSAPAAGSLASVGWLALTFCVVVFFFGELLRLPRWLVDLSPFSHLALVPAESFAWDPVLWQLTLAAVLVAAGLVADYLHRAALIATREYKAEGSGVARDKVIADFKTNRYDPSSDTVTYTDVQARAFTEMVTHYTAYFCDRDITGSAERDGVRLTSPPAQPFATAAEGSEQGPGERLEGTAPRGHRRPGEIKQLTAYFAWSAWSAWAGATLRPDKDYTYTNNWPPERLVDNTVTTNVVVRSVLSLIALLAGIGEGTGPDRRGHRRRCRRRLRQRYGPLSRSADRRCTRGIPGSRGSPARKAGRGRSPAPTPGRRARRRPGDRAAATVSKWPWKDSASGAHRTWRRTTGSGQQRRSPGDRDLPRM